MRRLYRSRYDKKLAGVCGGLGNYFRIDPTFIRLILIFVGVLTAFIPIIVVYFISALLIPLELPNSPALEYRRIYRSSKDRVITGICGGFAQFFKMDPTVLRLIAIVVTLISGFVPMLFAYLVGCFIIPEKQL